MQMQCTDLQHASGPTSLIQRTHVIILLLYTAVQRVAVAALTVQAHASCNAQRKTHHASVVQPVVREGDKCNRLFIVDQGLLSSKGRLLGCGAIVGEQHFLLDKGRWSHSANTVTYTRLLTLDKDTFDE